MPSMLGLTTDPSPHGLNAPGAGNWQQEASQMNDQQLMTRDNNSLQQQQQPQQEAEEEEQAPRRRKKNKSDRPRQRPRLPSDYDLEAGPNNILTRNKQSALEMEKLFWQSLCDRPRSVKKYMGKDAVVSNWPLFGDAEPLEGDDLYDALENATEFLSYRIGDQAQVVEVGLMAVAIVYPVKLFRPSGKPGKDGSLKVKTLDVCCSSSWRQVASGDWELCSSMVG